MMYFPIIDTNVHLAKLVEHFGEIVFRPAPLLPELTYIFLCFTNRCGSNYLAELLASSGDYNLAGEFLNWDTVTTHSQQRGFRAFQDYFAFLASKRQQSHCLIVKAAVSQIELLGRAGILDQVAGQSKFILIERSDKLGQAISHAIAFGTGRFTSWMAATRTPEDLEFSHKQIDDIINGITESNRRFDLFFAKNGIVPINVIYEQLVADQEHQAAFVARQLGLPNFSVATEMLRLERQSGQINVIWRMRYLDREHAIASADLA